MQVIAPEKFTPAFNAADARALRDRLVWFTAGPDRAKNDKLLLASLSQVRAEMVYNLRPSFPWLGVGSVIGSPWT